jgi:OOP family OmpA-OmpF porin
MHRRIVTGIAALGVLASGGAFAQATPWQGDFWGYIGVSGGQTKFRDECSRTITQFECDSKDSGWKVYAGGQIGPVFGVEVGYTDFGRIRSLGGETDAWAVPITLTAGVPIGERFRVFAKAGGLYARTDVRVDPTEFPDLSGDRNGWGWTYGAGASFNVAQNISIRADWDRHRLDFIGGRRDVDMLSAGVQFRF